MFKHKAERKFRVKTEQHCNTALFTLYHHHRRLGREIDTAECGYKLSSIH